MTNTEEQQIKPEPISTINPDGTSAINFNTDMNNLFNPGNQPNRPIYVKLQKFPDKYANTSPLGLLGFGMSTIFLSFSNVNAYKMNTMVVGTAIFYGGIAQFIAGTFEIRKGNTFRWSILVIICYHIMRTICSRNCSFSIKIYWMLFIILGYFYSFYDFCNFKAWSCDVKINIFDSNNYIFITRYSRIR